MVEPVIIGFPRIAYIYAIESVTGELQYIGSTITPIKQRIRGHITAAARENRLPIHHWINSVQSNFIVKCLSVVTEDKKDSEEKKFIKELNPPLNLTDGGKGLSGYKFAGTEHAKKIAAKLRTGKTFNCLRCGKDFWRKKKDILRSHNKYCSRDCSNRRQHAVA